VPTIRNPITTIEWRWGRTEVGPECPQSATGKEQSVRKRVALAAAPAEWAKNIQRSLARTVGVVGLRAHVDIAARHGRYRELRGLVNHIDPGLARAAAVPLRQAHGVEGVENSVRLSRTGWVPVLFRTAAISFLKCPQNGLGRLWGGGNRRRDPVGCSTPRWLVPKGRYRKLDCYRCRAYTT